jgi:hypothetical protein
MPEKKGTGRKGAVAAPDAATEVVPAAAEPVGRPAGAAPGPTGAGTPGEGEAAGAVPDPAGKPAVKKSAAVRMLTRSVAGKKPAIARGEAQRVADAARPTQKPQAGGGRRGPRRGASKGR